MPPDAQGEEQPRYEVVTSFGRAEVGKQRATRWEGFRVFPAVSAAAGDPPTRKKRTLNAVAGQGFDYHRDTLFDYPTVIAAKLGESDWRPYNRMVSVHVPVCSLKCWHCYNDAWPAAQGVTTGLVTAAEIVGKFADQWDFDAKLGLSTRVLRITGGEPFLAPDLVRECTELLAAKSRDCSCDFFLWTETNIVRFIGASGALRHQIQQCLEALARHERTAALHPCCHGIDSASGRQNSGPTGSLLTVESMSSALQWMIEEGVDIYPTLHANAVPPERLEPFFEALVKVHPNLPLRFALIELELTYDAARRRLQACLSRDPRPALRSKYAALWEWNRLIEKAYGLSYAVLPRHLVSLKRGESMRRAGEVPTTPPLPQQPAIADRELCILKSAKRSNYRQHALRILALPEGYIASAEYETSWVDQDAAEFGRVWPESFSEFPACLLYFEQDGGPDAEHVFVPLRRAKVVSLDVHGKLLRISYRLGPLFDPISGDDEGDSKAGTERFRAALYDLYGASVLPPVGASYMMLGSPISGLTVDRHTAVGRWQGIARMLSSPPLESLRDCAFLLLEHVQGAEMKERDGSTFWQARAGQDVALRLRWLVPGANSVHHTMHIESSDPELLNVVGQRRVELSKYGYADVTLHCGPVKQKQTVNVEISCAPNATKGPTISVPLCIVPPSFGKEAAVEAGASASSGIAAAAIGIFAFLGQQSLAAALADTRTTARAALSNWGPWLALALVASVVASSLLRRFQHRRA